MHLSKHQANSLQSTTNHLPNYTYYIVIYPTTSFINGKYAKLIQPQMNPYVFIIQDPLINNQELASLYITRNSLPLQYNQLYFWERQTTCPFSQMTVSDLAHKLQKQTIQGLCLQVNVADIDHSFYEDIAFLLPTPNKQMAEIKCYLPTSKQCFCTNAQLPLQKNQLSNMRNSIQKQLERELKIKIKGEIRLSFMWNNKQTLVTPQNCRNITKYDQIIVNFNDYSSVSILTQPSSNDFIVFSITGKRFAYSTLRQCKVHLILDNFLLFRKSGLRSQQFALKIQNTIILPHERLCQFTLVEALFENKKNEVAFIYAQVITASELLFLSSPTFKFGHIFPKNIVNEKQKQNEQQLKRRVEQSSNKLIKENPKTAYPIILYTKQQQLAYSTNSFLRNLSFAKMSSKGYFTWEYDFAKNLINSLKLMPFYEGKAYLGIKHKQQYKKGQTLQFKQLIACSTQQQAALSSEHNALYTFQNCKSARKIEQFSLSSDNIIFMPNRSFTITEVSTSTINSKVIDILTLVEKQPYKEYSQPSQKYILWVNKDTSEGIEQSKQEYILPYKTIHFIHMTSTSQLEDWLKANYKSGKQALRVALITNMIRSQKAILNQFAGADAIRVFRKYTEQGQFFVYMGRSPESVLADLRKRGIVVKDNQVSHKPAQLRNFLRRRIFE